MAIKPDVDEAERTELATPSPDSDGFPRVGDVVGGKYRIERLLGRGGMGVVLAAQHVDLRRAVAIKFMAPQAARDATSAERFMREARAAVELTSDHVARVLDVGALDTGAPYIVMEYLAGEDLAHLIARTGPLPVGVAVDYVLQACEGLAEAHAVGIVHRDLKPANLFLTKRVDGAALIKVLDFGVSKGATAGVVADLTASGIVVGSPGYMSPEQVRSAKDVDARSDVWALGVVLYELLTGRCPFMASSVGETFAKIVSEPPIAVRALRPDVPVEVARTIDRCLERRLEARIASAAALAAALAPFRDGATPLPVPLSLGESRPVVRQETVAAPITMGAAGTLLAPETSVGRSSGTLAAVDTHAHGLRARRSSRLFWACAVALLGVAIALSAIPLARSLGRRAKPQVAPAAKPVVSAPSEAPAAPVAPVGAPETAQSPSVAPVEPAPPAVTPATVDAGGGPKAHHPNAPHVVHGPAPVAPKVKTPHPIDIY